MGCLMRYSPCEGVLKSQDRQGQRGEATTSNEVRQVFEVMLPQQVDCLCQQFGVVERQRKLNLGVFVRAMVVMAGTPGGAYRADVLRSYLSGYRRCSASNQWKASVKRPPYANNDAYFSVPSRPPPCLLCMRSYWTLRHSSVARGFSYPVGAAGAAWQFGADGSLVSS
jgi:hypothetical protein